MWDTSAGLLSPSFHGSLPCTVVARLQARFPFGNWRTGEFEYTVRHVRQDPDEMGV